MFLHNRLYEIAVQAYNESTLRETGGLVEKSKSTAVSLCVLWLPPRQAFRSTEKGSNIVEKARIQVSIKELEDKSFTITVGDTHIIKDNVDYRVSFIKDASFMKGVQLKECYLVRKITTRNFV